jgi:hypothetical protein
MTIQNLAERPLCTEDDLFVPRITDLARFSRTDILDLLSGTVAAIGIRRFLPAQLCATAMARLDGGCVLDAYDRRRVDPPIARFGPVINDYKDDRRLRQDYWPRAGRDRAAWRAAMGPDDPLRTVIAGLAGAWGRPIRPARSDGRPLFAGAVREINDGALIHDDDVRREFRPGLFDEGTPIVQLAFNTWISVPERGGTTRIWRRRWHPADHRLRRGYGYDERAVAGEQVIEVSMGLGDALLFAPGNFHSVDPSAGGRRVAVAFFLGLVGRGELVSWS